MNVKSGFHPFPSTYLVQGSSWVGVYASFHGVEEGYTLDRFPIYQERDKIHIYTCGQCGIII